MLVGGLLLLEEHVSEHRLHEKSGLRLNQGGRTNMTYLRRDLTPQHRLMTYYGYSFESYCTKSSPRGDASFEPPESPPGWGGDVNTNTQHCHVVKTKLGQSRSASHP